ncbi:MAG: TolC family protein [Hyphomonadaceae bacterium]|nr:TolC family protein [Hyphomonadaceae bacterium]
MSFRSLAAGFSAVAFAVALTAWPATAQEADAPALRLEDAFSRALEDAPTLRASEQASRAAEAGVRQADRAVNPTIELGAENLGGRSTYQGVDRAETTLFFSQTLEMGGDRAARTQLAGTGVRAAQADGALRRRDLLFAVETAYVAAQVAAANLVVANDRLAVAKEIVATVDRRVQAARDPLMAASRSQALLADAEIAVTSTQLSAEAARRQLASYWDGDAAFAVDLSGFNTLAPSLGTLAGAAASPEIARARVEEERASGVIAVERARSHPDPIVSAGVRYFHEYDEAALVVGVTIPLTWWDNNSGAVDRAEAERSKLRLETEALRRNIAREVASAAAQVDIARSEIEAIDARLLPAAQQALERAREGYAAGAFSYLDVLDAQRVLVEARLQRNSALGSYHRARAALARLTGAYSGAAPERELSR